MKKLLMLSTVLIAFSAAPALADDHGGGKHGGKMFEKADTNGDGMISREEFDAVHADKFNKMDADGDGSISKDEAKARREAAKERWKDRKEKYKERRENHSDDSE